MKDIHKHAFDEGTQTKLEIFKSYVKEWLPVFLKIKEPYWNQIFLYDFFAGEGSDSEGNNGSPLILLDQIKHFCKDIKSKNLSVKIVFNEKDKKKYNRLIKASDEKLIECKKLAKSITECPNFNTDAGCVFKLELYNKDFQDFFSEAYNTMLLKPKLPRLMFLDQYGIKQITQEVFQKLISLERTDFMFFVSSSFAFRFIDLPEFQQYLKINREEFDEKKPYHCHRVIFDYYKKQIPSDKQFFLGHFSIKKNNNIYGLIFGSHHTLGIEKFLNVCWRENSLTGDANFDIDGDNIKSIMPKLFPEMEIPSKLDSFKNALRQKILTKELKTNKEVYHYTFEMGCLPKHANEVLHELIKQGKISKNINIRSSDIHNLHPTLLNNL